MNFCIRLDKARSSHPGEQVWGKSGVLYIFFKLLKAILTHRGSENALEI